MIDDRELSEGTGGPSGGTTRKASADAARAPVRAAAPTRPGTFVGQYSGRNEDGAWLWDGAKWTWKEGAQWDIHNRRVDIAPKPVTDMGGAFQMPEQPYSPFALQQRQPVGGAFGTGGYANGSNALVPQLEMIRMQRLLQAYPQAGGR